MVKQFPKQTRILIAYMSIFCCYIISIVMLASSLIIKNLTGKYDYLLITVGGIFWLITRTKYFNKDLK